MYKYEILGDEIIKYLTQQKKNGFKRYTLRATDVNEIFEITKICDGSRYPMICQAMTYATQRYRGTHVDGVNPSSSFTVEYKLTLF